MKNISVKIDGVMVLALFAAAAGVYLYSRRGVIGEKLNPASDQNFIYSGISGAGAAITGDDHWNLGGAVYDWAH